MGLAGEVRGAVEERGASGEEQVVEPEVKNGGKGLAEGDERGGDADDGARDDVVPVVDCETTIV